MKGSSSSQQSVLPRIRTLDPLAERGAAYVLDDFPVRSERFIAREIGALRGLGIRVALCLLRPGRSAASSEVHRVSVGALVRSVPSVVGTSGSSGWRTLRWRLIGRGHAEALKGRPPAMIHAHFATLPLVVARFLASELRLPWGVSVHAQDLYAQPAHVFASRVRGASYVLACSPAAAEEVRARAGARVPVFVVHHGLDLREWPLQPKASSDPSSAPHLLAVGRFVEKKNLASLVEACGLLKARYPALRCTIVGEGPLGPALRRTIARIAAPVAILPWQDERALRELYRSATLLVAPGVVAADGDRDNISNVILEAMASGLPVVSCKVSQDALAPEDAGCLLAAEPSPGGLAAAIDRALSNPSLLETARGTGRRVVERRFDLARNAQDLARILRAAARGRFNP
jgi:glycosyltransferase involved in cell wall biosynthesis